MSKSNPNWHSKQNIAEHLISPYNGDEDEQDGDNGTGTGTAVQEARPRLKRPPLYRVILLNDDFTPMDFVVEVLMRFFAMSEERATQIMLHVHSRGVGVCGVFTRDIAETKVQQVNEYSRSHQHPLLCTMEEA